MSTLFTRGTRTIPAGGALDDPSAGSQRVEHPSPNRVDSNSVRWVFAATVAFWLVVYAAGRSFL